MTASNLIQYYKSENMKLEQVDILAFGAHPDDIELGCCGTLAKHIALGYTVGICDLTQGELGSRGSAELRLKEAKNSAKLLGAKWRVNLGMADGFFQNTKTNVLEISRIIRQARPKIVLANALSDRHPDHGKGAKLVKDGCFMGGLLKIELEDEQGRPLAKHRPDIVMHYIQDREIAYNCLYDISGYMDKKLECILAFTSQFYQGKDDNGPQTPISGEQFLNFVKSKNAVYGRDIQADYAEAFIVERKFGVDDFMHLL